MKWDIWKYVNGWVILLENIGNIHNDYNGLFFLPFGRKSGDDKCCAKLSTIEMPRCQEHCRGDWKKVQTSLTPPLKEGHLQHSTRATGHCYHSAVWIAVHHHPDLSSPADLRSTSFKSLISIPCHI